MQAVIREAVTAEASAMLPRGGGALPGPLRTELADLARNETVALMVSPAFQQLWAEANQSAHTQLVSILNGNSTLVPATSGQVAVNLIPLVNVLHDISEILSAMTGRTVIRPAPTTGQPATRAALRTGR